MDTLEFLRQFRIGGYAIFDFAASFLGIYLLSPLLTKLFRKVKLEIPKKNWLFLAIPLSVLVHLLVGTMTPMTLNFIDLKGHYILKIVIIGLMIMGLRGIKKTAKSPQKR